jgi:hypothetical protein
MTFRLRIGSQAVTLRGKFLILCSCFHLDQPDFREGRSFCMQDMTREPEVRIDSIRRLIDQCYIAGELHRAIETAVELRGDFVFLFAFSQDFRGKYF